MPLSKGEKESTVMFLRNKVQLIPDPRRTEGLQLIPLTGGHTRTQGPPTRVLGGESETSVWTPTVAIITSTPIPITLSAHSLTYDLGPYQSQSAPGNLCMLTPKAPACQVG